MCLAVTAPTAAAAPSGLAEADSLYSLAESRLAVGDYAGAAEFYSDAVARIESLPDVEQSAYTASLKGRARFLAGRAHELAGDWGDAARAYELAIADLPIVADAAMLRLALCYNEMGDFERAVDLLREVADDDTRTTFHLAALEALGDTYREAGEFDMAVQWYRVLLSGSESYDDRARAHYKIGLALVDRGDRGAAEESFGTAVVEFPRSRYAYDALREGRKLSKGFTDRYHQGLVLYNQKRYRDACEFFSYYLRHDPDKEFAPEATYFLGRAYQRRGRFRSAAKRYEDVIGYGPDCEYFDAAWLKLAYTLRVLGRVEDSIDTYDRYLLLYADREGAPTVQWEKARLLEEEGRWTEALATFNTLAERYPDAETARAARFRAALCLFKLGRYREADGAFADLAASAGTDLDGAARALFWAGKSGEALGEIEQAQARYREAAETAPDSFYGRRASARLAATGPAGDRGSTRPTSSDRSRPLYPFRSDAELRDFASWLAGWYEAVYMPGTRVDLYHVLRSRPSFARADAFLALHMRAAAERELRVLEDEFGGDPRMLDVLSTYYERVGLSQRAIRLAEWILELSPADGPGAAPAYLRKKICPIHFEEIVLRECSKRGLDPGLLFSLIRQESLFEADAVSWVGARGLAQIMPRTGKWIARRLGEKHFRLADLMRPETSIRFGAYYLAEQLEKFDGDLMRALAAYNGGPENVERWWRYGGESDSDVFVEDIGFSQTAAYVKRVYLYAEFYRETYGGFSD